MDFRAKWSQRIKSLPPYLFARIDEKKREAMAKGMDIINLGIGDPDTPTLPPIVEAARIALGRPEHHQYPSYEGMLSFRESIAHWYKKRFLVDLDPHTEVLGLIGSKEGIGHMPLAFIDPGDTVLVPEPGYPVYHAGTLFAGGETYYMPILESNGFLPDLSAIPDSVYRRTKIMFINYPNNPTGAVAPDSFFAEVIEKATKYGFIVAHDAAYSEIYFDGNAPKSFLSFPGAKEVGIEFHSLSKTFNMTGWRVGFAVGNASVLAGLGKIKSNMDSGIFQALQEASIAAMALPDFWMENLRSMYQERRDVLVSGLRTAGLRVIPPGASFYLWAGIPAGMKSEEASLALLSRTGIVATPGNGFGISGEGYVRFALTVDTPRLKEAIDRIVNEGLFTPKN
ncbi:LL-diaminopimelate aminotransferase [Leptospirillum ferrooxidans]|jgi:LL-diaminopimelate aminotransferase|uniref:Aminotransferase n=1 Tax=Leptospirillum ferrooxidans (strain C2-3) TaxID=1162668 RepID=I0IL76_LEPFC|nr:LL-diaminopimelate aminotransferase [Leptospirillum ferrooxidans]BAM06025.1 aspartate aminotransferase [Leptospirillum ferrooxidans C2-3]